MVTKHRKYHFKTFFTENTHFEIYYAEEKNGCSAAKTFWRVQPMHINESLGIYSKISKLYSCTAT
jgi:hypothetical protein